MTIASLAVARACIVVGSLVLGIHVAATRREEMLRFFLSVIFRGDLVRSGLLYWRYLMQVWENHRRNKVVLAVLRCLVESSLSVFLALLLDLLLLELDRQILSVWYLWYAFVACALGNSCLQWTRIPHGWNSLSWFVTEVAVCCHQIVWIFTSWHSRLSMLHIAEWILFIDLSVHRWGCTFWSIKKSILRVAHMVRRECTRVNHILDAITLVLDAQRIV